jgi:hypothetical protein
MDEIEKLKAAGFSDEQIQAYLARKQQAAPAAPQAAPPAPMPTSAPNDVPGVAESAVRGVGEGLFGLGDNAEAMVKSIGPARTYVQELIKAKRRNREAREANPKAYIGGETVGLAVPVLGATLATAGMGAPAAFGTALATGAAMGAGKGDGDVGQTIGGATLGAGGYAAGSLAGWAGGRLRDLLFPRLAARREVAQVFDPKTVNRMLEQEQLAPGTVVAADASKQATKLARPVGQAPTGRAALEAERTSARQADLQDALDKVAQQYPAKTSLVPITPETQRVMLDNGLMPNPAGQETVETLMDLRRALRARVEAAGNRVAVGNEKTMDRAAVATARKAAHTITQNLQQVPGFAPVDRQYAVLATARRGAERTSKAVADALGTAGPNKVMGNTPTSAGGHLTNGGSLLDRLHFLDAIKESNAKALADEALRPLTAKQIQALGNQYRQSVRAPGVGLMRRLLRQAPGQAGGLLFLGDN